MGKMYLFVYGTLRREYGLELMKEIQANFRFYGGGKIKATLYDLGSYPAAVKSKTVTELWGDVYEVVDAATALAVLDDYEGDEYTREMTMVVMETGDVVSAWVYWYTGNTDAALLVAETDYLDYLKNKKDRFV